MESVGSSNTHSGSGTIIDKSSDDLPQIVSKSSDTSNLSSKNSNCEDVSEFKSEAKSNLSNSQKPWSVSEEPEFLLDSSSQGISEFRRLLNSRLHSW